MALSAALWLRCSNLLLHTPAGRPATTKGDAAPSNAAAGAKPAPAAVQWAMSLLRRGDQGEAVRALQAALRRCGAAIDDEPGAFGLSTEAAIYALQHGEGLGADGIVGPATQARLQREPAPAGLGVPLLHMVRGVPYFSQRDNFHHPSGTCNVSALAMALAHQGVRPRAAGRQLEDELFEEISSPEGQEYFREHCPDSLKEGLRPNTVFEMLVWVARRRGVSASFSTERTPAELRAEIDAGRPVVISGAFTGSGHIVLLLGYTATGDLVCHDPWGDWMRGYRNAQGEARIYEREQTLSVLKNVGRERTWGLFVGG